MKNKTMCIQCGKKAVRFDLRDISGMEPEEGFCSIKCVDQYELELSNVEGSFDWLNPSKENV
jgi:hypothetical protein